jgi:hypothetical protein
MVIRVQEALSPFYQTRRCVSKLSAQPGYSLLIQQVAMAGLIDISIFEQVQDLSVWPRDNFDTVYHEEYASLLQTT